MEKQIKRFLPSDEKLEGLDNLITKIPELKDLIKESKHGLDLIIKGIDTLHVNDNYKKAIKQLFVSLQKCSTTLEIYKYSNFKNQDTIQQLLKREQDYIKIIKDQADKHSDTSGIDEINKMFSAIIINPLKNQNILNYTNTKIKDIKFYDDFKPIFEIPGEKTYTKGNIHDMKTTKKGTRFNNVDVVNISKK